MAKTKEGELKKATEKQRREYIEAVQQKRPVPTGFIWDSINLWVDDGVERPNLGIGHQAQAPVPAAPSTSDGPSVDATANT